MERNVVVYNGYSPLRFTEQEIVRLVHALDDCPDFSVAAGELSIAFLDNETVRIMHGEYLADPVPTDVITFPGDPAENFAGEICISVDYAIEYAEDQGSSLSHELVLYLVHGWLHLAGLDDRTPEDARKMRDAEAKILDFLKKNGLLPMFTL